MLEDIKEQLKAPFALEDIDFLPKGKTERDGKTLCMAFPYADPRVYQDRLNELAYGEWSTPAPVVIAAGNKLICYVTVILFGVPHTDVGEATNNEENTGTEAFAQAFKRACSQFGLGRYLYDLDREWVPFKVEGKSGRIDLDKAGKAAIVRKMYQKAGIATGQATTPKPALQTVPAQLQAQDAQPEAPSTGNMILDDMPPSGGQLENIRQLALHLGARIQKPKTFKEAAQLLDSMQSDWDQMKSRGRAS